MDKTWERLMYYYKKKNRHFNDAVCSYVQTDCKKLTNYVPSKFCYYVLFLIYVTVSIL